MTPPLITSRRNPLVKRLKRLGTREGRVQEGLLILEGTHLLQEVIAQRAQPVELIATPAWVDRHGELFGQLPDPLPIHWVSQDVLAAALSTVTPDGVACLVHWQRFRSRPRVVISSWFWIGFRTLAISAHFCAPLWLQMCRAFGWDPERTPLPPRCFGPQQVLFCSSTTDGLDQRKGPLSFSWRQT